MRQLGRHLYLLPLPSPSSLALSLSRSGRGDNLFILSIPCWKEDRREGGADGGGAEGGVQQVNAVFHQHTWRPGVKVDQL